MAETTKLSVEKALNQLRKADALAQIKGDASKRRWKLLMKRPGA
jgi:hypothetical protein